MKLHISRSSAPKSNSLHLLKLKNGKTITVGDTWTLKLPESDDYAQEHDMVGHEFNVVITRIHKNGEFRTIELVDQQVVENSYNQDYLKRLVYKSKL